MGNYPEKRLNIDDGIIRDTVGARLNIDAEIIHHGDVDLSTGILMRKGVVKVNGNAGKNTGALLNGGTVVINGNSDDFSAIEMKKGTLVINGDAGKFMGAQKEKWCYFGQERKSYPSHGAKKSGRIR